MMSFKTYVALETRQNTRAASRTCRHRSHRVRLWEKISAAKMNPFLTHCCGRRVSTSARRVERRGSAVLRADEDVSIASESVLGWPDIITTPP